MAARRRRDARALRPADVDSSYAADVLPGLLVMGLGMGLIFAPAMETRRPRGVDRRRRRRRLGDGQHRASRSAARSAPRC